MSRIRSWLAYLWASLATPLVLATFVGNPLFAGALANGMGVSISPRITGGPPMAEVVRDGYRVLLRQPVFAGLLGPRATGFIQIEWLPDDARELPVTVETPVDFDRDGIVDFVLAMNTRENTATLSVASDAVLGIDRVFALPRDRVVRVALRRAKRPSCLAPPAGGA
jgi:hypothetical protein